MSNWHAAEAWRRRGFRVFPIVAGTKKPHIEGYQHEASNDSGTVLGWWAKWPDADVGFILGDGTLLIDVDVKNGAPGLQSFFELGLSFDTLTGRTPSGGYHLYYSEPNDFANSVGLFPGIDIRSAGGMALAPGSRGYTIESDLPLAPLPEVLRAHLRPPLAEKSAVQLVPRDHVRNRQDAIHFLQTIDDSRIAVKGMGGNSTIYKVACELTNDFALSAGTAFSLMWAYYAPKCIPPFRPDQSDEFEAIVSHAYEYARGAIGTKTSLYMFGAPVVVPQTLPAISPPDKWPELGNFGNVIEPKDWKPAPWVAKNLLMRGVVSALIAPGGTGKSTISLYIAAHVILGRPIAPGWDIKQPGRVMVVNLEETRESMSKKLVALCSELDLDFTRVRNGINLVSAEDFPFKITEDAKGKLNEEHVSALISKAKAHEVVAGIFDPLNYLHDVAEQDNSSMASIIKHLSFVAASANISVLFNHHTSKSGINRKIEPGNAEMSRGASAIIDNARHALTLVHLPKEEAAERGIPEEDRDLFTRLDIAKTNLCAKRPPIYFKRADTGSMDGETIPVFRPHSWDESEGDDLTAIGRMLWEIMGEKEAGAVTQQELVERWRSEDAIRDKMDKEAVTEALRRLYKLRGCFSHTEEGRTHQFYRGKQGKHVVYSMQALDNGNMLT